MSTASPSIPTPVAVMCVVIGRVAAALGRTHAAALSCLAECGLSEPGFELNAWTLLTRATRREFLALVNMRSVIVAGSAAPTTAVDFVRRGFALIPTLRAELGTENI